MATLLVLRDNKEAATISSAKEEGEVELDRHLAVHQHSVIKVMADLEDNRMDGRQMEVTASNRDPVCGRQPFCYARVEWKDDAHSGNLKLRWREFAWK